MVCRRGVVVLLKRFVGLFIGSKRGGEITGGWEQEECCLFISGIAKMT